MILKVTLRELTDAEGSLMKVLGKETFNFKLAYRLRRLADKVMSELKHLQKVREEKIKELGAIDKVGGFYKVKPENMQIYRDGLSKLLEEEVEMNVDLIPIDLLEAEVSRPESKFKLSAIDLSLLGKFIDHGVESKKPEKPKKAEGGYTDKELEGVKTKPEKPTPTIP